jgi:hypothetical protein
VSFVYFEFIEKFVVGCATHLFERRSVRRAKTDPLSSMHEAFNALSIRRLRESPPGIRSVQQLGEDDRFVDGL